MRAGDLRTQIGIQTRQQTGTGDRGQPILTWTTTATVPGAVEDLTGRRLEIARQLVAEATHVVRIRFLPGLSVRANRLIVNGQTFAIGAIQNKAELNFELALTCVSQEGK